MTKPRYRLAVDAALTKGVQVSLRDNAAHYVSGVLRLGVGDAVSLFSKADGEWRAVIAEIRKKELVLSVEECTRPPSARGMELIVCFAPIKGGRLETIIEKATELGASVLQPVITARTIVDKVNLARAEAIAREAAEQCERIDWPEIREPVKLATLLAGWPADVPLIYGDERGESGSILQLFSSPEIRPHPKNVKDIFRPLPKGEVAPAASLAKTTIVEVCDEAVPQLTSALGRGLNFPLEKIQGEGGRRWAVLTGPEGGFTPEEFAALARVKSTMGVGLGPRILRADTAVITLCVATLMAWGDWDERPRFGV